MSGATGGFLLLSVSPAAADPQDHTTICHATGSEQNPYVVINPANPGVENGHRPHQNGEDVIPAPDGAQRGPTHGSQECEAEQTPPTHEPPTNQPPVEHGQPPVVKPPTQQGQQPVAQQPPAHAPVAQTVPATAATPASRPIPNAVSAGANTAADWQLPVGGALIVLGAAGAAGMAIRRTSDSN